MAEFAMNRKLFGMVMTGVPKTERQARFVIVSNANKVEREHFRKHPEDLQKHIDAIMGRIDDDKVGRRWVYCRHHGMQNTAMKFGIDDRCNKCVSEQLGSFYKNKTFKVEPMKSPLGGIFFWDYKYPGVGDKDE